MKFCGVVTPFRGVRVYARSAMGIPGSETALAERLCRVLGSLLKEGSVVKIADDLFCGGNTIDEVLNNWRSVLACLLKANLHLSPRKTVICPKSTTTLGWTWNSGSLSANSHRIATLVNCSVPPTIKGLRSFIGAYKVLARVLPGCASVLSPLDDITVGK
ncbi:uncharacterized protein LOC121386039 [Gigantopelta aegis]|uniref:uncharacterized protein LOC121386039 n=1 Tax=Gigantopelta aegis TaxID=1735272 RepID=UPI001B88A499|nr:uncharacterized protein LOC121386039 [Gigantopelta aegis]